MESRDQANLEFIKSLDGDQFNEWIDTLSPDDIDYALLLVNSDIAQLQEQLTELRLERMDRYPDADSVLKRVM